MPTPLNTLKSSVFEVTLKDRLDKDLCLEHFKNIKPLLSTRLKFPSLLVGISLSNNLSRLFVLSKI